MQIHFFQTSNEKSSDLNSKVSRYFIAYLSGRGVMGIEILRYDPISSLVTALGMANQIGRASCRERV